MATTEEESIEWLWVGIGLGLLILFIVLSTIWVNKDLSENMFALLIPSSLSVFTLAIISLLAGFNAIN